MRLPESSRSLLLPGPQPPLSHFGATLLKHVITTGVRFAFHSLGAPMPEGAPVRIVGLRVFLDRDRLGEISSDGPAAEALLGACLDPGGRRAIPRGALRGALAFHRTRLRLRFARRPRPVAAPPGESSAQLWELFRSAVAAFQPTLDDALLGELVASFERRAERERGRRLGRCLGREAFAVHTGARADLSSLGVVDPMTDPWSDSEGVEQVVARRLDEVPALGDADRAHPLRGEFREAYRRALNPIRATYLRLASDARRRGLIEEVGDAFFVPFELTRDLAGDRAPDWLRPAVTSNRAEYQSLLERGSPGETITPATADATIQDREDWMLSPIWPLE